MNIMGKRQDQNLDNEYKLPTVIRNNNDEIPLGKAVVISSIAHPAIAGFLWLLIKGILLLMAILGITLPLFERPQPKMRDIEFVLVNKPEQKPVNPNTKNRADRNSRAGGKHDPKRSVSEPEPTFARSNASQSSPKGPVTPKRVTAPRPTVQRPQKQAMQQDRLIPPRPAPQQQVSRPRAAHHTPFSIPVPISKAPRAVSPQGGPVTSGPIGYSSPDSSPAPVMAPGGGQGGRSRGRYSSGYSPGGGNVGNPSPGNPHGSPGIDAIKEPDFGPYMRELERRIKRHWNPRGNQSRTVILYFKIGKRGELLTLRVYKSSGSPEIDQAALSAVQLSAPFRPLPPETRDNSIDIQFTFDYNVVGTRR